MLYASLIPLSSAIHPRAKRNQLQKSSENLPSPTYPLENQANRPPFARNFKNPSYSNPCHYDISLHRNRLGKVVLALFADFPI